MTPAPGGVQLRDISLVVLPPYSRTRNRNFYIKLNHHEERTCTTRAKSKSKSIDHESHRVVWDESFSFVGDITDDSTITFKLKETRFGFSTTIGSREEKVIDLLPSQSNIRSCQLNVVDGYRIVFTIERLSTVVSSLVDETLAMSRLSEGRTAEVIRHVKSVAVFYKDHEETWNSFLSHFRTFMKAMDKISEVDRYAKIAWSILSVIPKIVLLHETHEEKIRKLCQTLSDTYGYITDAQRLSELSSTQADTLTVLSQQTVECAYFIREYASGNIAQKVWKGLHMDEKLNAFHEKFDHLRDVMKNSVALESNIVTLRVSDITNEIKDLTLLGEMPYARDAGLKLEKTCFAGTRQSLIQEIVGWVNNGDPSSHQILAITGQAGTGKSALAHTIANLFQKQNRLGSFFCFSRTYKDRRNILFSTISRDLADGDVMWRRELVKVIRKTAIRTSTDVTTQFNELIVKPSKEVATIGPVVIIIDALDESGNRSEREGLLEILLEEISILPTNYRIILTFRPEQDIQYHCERSGMILCKRMDDIAAPQSFSDIQAYISFKLHPIANTLEKIDTNWSNLLAKRAEGLFQWAETACRFLNPTIRYPAVIERRWEACISSSSSSLYELYHQIISSQDESKDPEFLGHFKLIVCAVMTSRIPLSTDVLQSILQDVVQDVKAVLGPYHSLFSGLHDSSIAIQPLHTSLFDFFNNEDIENGKNQYFIDTSDEGFFTSSCLKLLDRMLHFNICNLETSHQRNQDVPQFLSRVETAIPPHLSYACLFWPNHLQKSSPSEELLAQIRTLMDKNLLYLFEALSLLGETERGSVAMGILADWSEKFQHMDRYQDLVKQAWDACHFIEEFGFAIVMSTPHLYLSALPFAAGNSFIAQRYLPSYPQLLRIEASQVPISTVKSGITKRTVSSAPTCTTCSPQGRFVATGFKDGSFWFWDYKTGETVSRWEATHQDRLGICRIVFSPNGETVYCCFRDGSLRIWNTKTKTIVDDFLKGVFPSSSYSQSCTISSDGRYFVFETHTGELLLYDRETRLKPLSFEVDNRNVCALSANGLLAFNKRGGGVSLWNMRTQRLMSLTADSMGHLKFSPDGNYMALGRSMDVEVWNMSKLTMITRILVPHSDTVAFSADNSYLIVTSLTSYSIWTIPIGAPVRQSDVESYIQSVEISPNPEYVIFSVGELRVKPWEELLLSTSTSEVIESRGRVYEGLVLHGRYLIQAHRQFQNPAEFWLQVSDITTTNNIVLEKKITDWSHIFISPGGGLIVHRTPEALHLWNEGAHTVIRKSGAEFVMMALTGFSIISGDSRRTVEVWDSCSRRLKYGPHEMPGSILSLQLSAATENFLVAHGTLEDEIIIEVRNVSSGCILHSVVSPRIAGISEVTFSPDETRFIYLTREHVEILAKDGRTRFFLSTQISPGRNYLLLHSGETKAISIWDIDEEKTLWHQWLKNSDCWILSGFSSHTGNILWAISDTKTLEAWNVKTGETAIQSITLPSCCEDISHLSLDFNENALALVLHGSYGGIWNLSVHNIMSHTYERHRRTTRFGTYPMDIDRSDVKQVKLDNPETLEYAVIAWKKALFSAFAPMNNDGWILGPHGELLFWVPKKRRDSLWYPCMTHMAAKYFTKLDFSNFIHGVKWAECRD